MSIISTNRTGALAALILSVGLATPLSAQEAPVPNLLPGGASSLTETHGDWTINCQMVTRNETAERVCGMSQRQTNEQGQQVLAIQLVPSEGGLEGALVLPFGVAVTQPVSLTIDEGDPIAASFSTCLPAGCVVPIEAGSDTFAAMRTGSVMSVAAATVEGETFELPASLRGFSAATNRIADLTQ